MVFLTRPQAPPAPFLRITIGTKPRVQARLRIYTDDSIAFGPGKVAVLEGVAETGGISAAARQLGMSYRRAWMLIDEMNATLPSSPAVNTASAACAGGGICAFTPLHG